MDRSKVEAYGLVLGMIAERVLALKAQNDRGSPRHELEELAKRVEELVLGEVRGQGRVLV